MSGRNDFEADIKELGGIDAIARSPYARNMWFIIKEFNSLPSPDGTFRTLTSNQVNFMFAEYKIDAREQEAADKGQTTDLDSTYYDDDDSWWTNPSSEYFTETEEEIEDTRRQILAMSDTSTKETIYNNLVKLNSTYNTKEEESDIAKAQAEVDAKLNAVYDTLSNSSTDYKSIKKYREDLKKDSKLLESTSDDTNESYTDTTLINKLNGSD